MTRRAAVARRERASHPAPEAEDLELDDYTVVRASRGCLAAIFDSSGRFVALAGFKPYDADGQADMREGRDGFEVLFVDWADE